MASAIEPAEGHAPSGSTERLSARGLVVRLSGVEVVRGVDLALSAGEILGVLGPSGAGKSTLFRALAGELAPRAGRVFLEGCDVTREPLWKRARRGLGYVPQTPSVLVDLTVADNFATFERLAPRAEARGAAHWARQMDLTHALSVRAGELSGGERRRLELGRALVGRPRVLICDEPFAGIDPAGAERVAALLTREAAAGLAVLLADHHVPSALAICQRAALLLDGRIEVVAPPDEFRAHPLVGGRYLGSLPPLPPASPLAR